MASGRRIYWDSCCFISFLNGDPARVGVLGDLVRTAAGKGAQNLLTSALSQVEVAYVASEKLTRQLDPSEEKRIDDMWGDRDALSVVEIHDGITRRARELMRNAMQQNVPLKPPDAIHMATAEYVRADELHTYDQRMQQAGVTLVAFPVVNPRIDQGPLFRT